MKRRCRRLPGRSGRRSRRSITPTFHVKPRRKAAWTTRSTRNCRRVADKTIERLLHELRALISSATQRMTTRYRARSRSIASVGRRRSIHVVLASVGTAAQVAGSQRLSLQIPLRFHVELRTLKRTHRATTGETSLSVFNRPTSPDQGNGYPSTGPSISSVVAPATRKRLLHGD